MIGCLEHCHNCYWYNEKENVIEGGREYNTCKKHWKGIGYKVLHQKGAYCKYWKDGEPLFKALRKKDNE